MTKLMTLVALGCFAAGCATSGERLEIGDIIHETPIGEPSASCVVARVVQTVSAEPSLPTVVSAQLQQRVYDFRYDIDLSGQPVNIQYLGPPEYSGARQQAVRAAGEALQRWRFEPVDRTDRHFVTGCLAEIDVGQPDSMPYPPDRLNAIRSY